VKRRLLRTLTRGLYNEKQSQIYCGTGHSQFLCKFPDFIFCGLAERLPKAGFSRSLVVGLIAMLTVGVATVAMLVLFGVNQLPVWDYILYHSFYMAVLAGIVSVPATKSALAGT